MECWGTGGDDVGQRDPPEDQFVQVSVGGEHACAVGSDATVSCWGGDTNHLRELTAPADTEFAQVAAGGSLTCGIYGVGRVHCWGDFRTTPFPD
jgi:alpha-tubulin suppressor-like RCC1 family protein